MYISLQLVSMDISLDKTVVLPNWVLIFFASLGLWRLALAFTGIKAFWLSLTAECPLVSFYQIPKPLSIVTFTIEYLLGDMHEVC